ncbi:MAG TPA: hypothetical protein VH234_04835 [Candidatus Saccharimonadales bacterium]|nr:hypothetical protein [Candidatus Saccharimonadales bacterium]
MKEMIKQLNARFPALHFMAGRQFSWSPETGEIFYRLGAKGRQAQWSLLHETGHALLGHSSYKADVELLRLEVDAWQKARQLADELSLKIDESHIEDCLDTYRDWLYKRSICPNCTAKCLQQADFVHYRCFNCHKVWRVSTNRFCRAYRSTKNVPQPTLQIS